MPKWIVRISFCNTDDKISINCNKYTTAVETMSNALSNALVDCVYLISAETGEIVEQHTRPQAVVTLTNEQCSALYFGIDEAIQMYDKRIEELSTLRNDMAGSLVRHYQHQKELLQTVIPQLGMDDDEED